MRPLAEAPKTVLEIIATIVVTLVGMGVALWIIGWLVLMIEGPID